MIRSESQEGGAYSFLRKPFYQVLEFSAKSNGGLRYRILGNIGPHDKISQIFDDIFMLAHIIFLPNMNKIVNKLHCNNSNFLHGALMHIIVLAIMAFFAGFSGSRGPV